MRRIGVSLVLVIIGILLLSNSVVGSMTLASVASATATSTLRIPTITALPLVPQSKQFRDDPAYMRSLYAVIPDRLGQFKVIKSDQSYMNAFLFGIENTDGKIYGIELMVYPYMLNENIMIRQTSLMQNPQAVNVGDEAYTSTIGFYLATMRFRNVHVTIQDVSKIYHLPTPTATPLPISATQWTEVLQDIKAWLDHGVLP